MDVTEFFDFDFNGTLFPMKTNLLLMKHHKHELAEYVGRVLSTDPSNSGYNFFAQARVYAAKPRNHLRRTVLLDPIATYFIYDLIARNSASFDLPSPENRRFFGYRFDGDSAIPVHRAYRDFAASVEANKEQYDHYISFDIASYFNSIYHHDASNWFAGLPGVSGIDSNAFGRFFREINAGKSIDFLPQGIYPTKMIGSGFLTFIESSGQLKCAATLRFMDDIYLFDDDETTLLADFHRIQELIGLHALNINPTKTIRDGQQESVRDTASTISEELSELVGDDPSRFGSLPSGIDPEDVDEDYWADDAEAVDSDAIGEEKRARLLELLADPKADEADAELILGILRDKVESLAPQIGYIFARFPNVAKQIHNLVSDAQSKDRNAICKSLTDLVRSDAYLIEYQLFWIAVIAEDHLSSTSHYGDLLVAIYERSTSYKIARAKVLEIPTQDFGFKQIRDEILKSGSSDWPSWAAAMGARNLAKAERNQTLKYFARASSLNHIVANCVMNLP
jgi:hypothetical protein